MALAILDGNQSATTLSSIIVSSEHIPAHTVVSLGTQAKTDILSAVSSGIVISGAVTASGSISILNAQVALGTTAPSEAIQIGGYNLADNNLYPIAVDSNGVQSFVGTVTIGGGTVTIGSALPAGTNRIGVVTIGAGTVTIGAGTAQIGSVTLSSFGTAFDAQFTDSQAGGIVRTALYYKDTEWYPVTVDDGLPVSVGNLVSLNPLPAGTNRIGVVTIGGGTVTIGAGTAQIGSVTASISGTVPISISSVTIGNSVTIGSLPAISGTVTAGNLPISPFGGVNTQLINDEGNAIGVDVPFLVSSWNSQNIPISGVVTVSNIQTVTAGSPLFNTTKYPTAFVGYDVTNGAWQAVPLSEDGDCVIVGNSLGAFRASNLLPISGTVTANTFAVQGTSVTTSNFTSTTASTVLAGFNTGREVLTIFNEGAGNLHICAGATCTTIAYQVRLSAGDYYEVPNHQTTITHSAVFATAGTARVTEVN